MLTQQESFRCKHILMVLCCLCFSVNGQENLLSSGWTVYIDIDINSIKYDAETGNILVPSIGKNPIRQVDTNQRYEIDISKLANRIMPEHYALLTTTVKSSKSKKIRIGCSADWWMQWRVNGKIVYDTMTLGNSINPTSITDNVFDVDLQKGNNAISVLVRSGRGGWKLIAAAGSVLDGVALTKKKNIDDYRNNPLEFTFNELPKEKFNLPKLLTNNLGEAIKTSEEWSSGRRSEILQAMSKYIYGTLPHDIGNVYFKVIETDRESLSGRANFSKIEASIERNGKSLCFYFYLFVPNNCAGKAPVFLHVNHRFKETDDIIHDNPSWPVNILVEHGYATISFAPRVLANDITGEINPILMQLYPESFGKTDSWGTIAIWTYGAMRLCDYLVNHKDIDKNKIAIIGHSRSGKTAAWTGANDQRFSLICANGSGCTGIALTRRYRGETIENVNRNFPSWFNTNYKYFNQQENTLPVDQHMLVSLIAPRALAVGCGVDDSWADPKGEFLSICYAAPVFKLFNQKCFNITDTPKLDQALRRGKLSFHVRTGGHSLKNFDWLQYINFADSIFGIFSSSK